MLGRRFTRWRSAALLLLAIAASARAENPPPLEAYGQLPTMEQVTLSPSGERFAFAADGPDRRRHLFVVSVDQQPLAMPALGEIKLRRISWAGERFVVAGTSNTYNLGLYYGFRRELMNYQVLDLDRHGESTSLLGGTKTLAAAFGAYGLFERDARWYGYLGALPLSRSPLTGEVYLGDVERNLMEVDLESGKQRTAATGCEQCVDWLLGDGGVVLASVQYDQRSSEWRLYAGSRRDRLLVRARDPLGRNAILGQGRSAGTVLYQQADADGALRYLELALSGAGTPTEILADEQVRSLLWDDRSHLLAGFVRDGNDAEWVMFDEQRAARVRGTRKAFPGLSVRFDSASADFQKLVVYTQGAGRNGKGGDSGTYWLVDIVSGQARVLGEAYPKVRPQHIGSWQTIDYRAADGLALQGVLTLPPGREPRQLPLVVLPHGGPEARDYAQFDWWAQAFASRGYAVWQPNFRGSTGYGAALRNAGNGEWGGKMQSDLSDGTAELARRGLIDPQRVCIVGGSYGGYAALAGVTLQQGQYRCAVSYAGIADLKDQLLWRKNRFGDAALRDRLRWLGARSSSDPVVAQRSPQTHVVRADAPILLIHGRDDTIVPHAQSKLMHQALLKAGKPAELLTLEGEDHWLSRGETRTAMLKAAVAFVQRHNPAVTAQAGSVKAPD